MLWGPRAAQVLGLLILSSSAYALDLPVFPANFGAAAENSIRALQAFGPVQKFEPAQVKHFRVLIFPHFGTYSIPQGQEASANSVLVTSGSTCSEYLALLDENREWVKSGTVIAETSRRQFTRAALTDANGYPKPKYFECREPFVVNRARGLRSLEYSGDFVATVEGKNVQIINVIDPDVYVEGVVPAEVEANWPMETLKAQAIAARSYAWWCVLNSRGKNLNFDMDDTVFFQAYLGNLRRTQMTDEATQATEGVVMKYEHEIIKAYFSADSGGFTESALSAFGDDYPYCLAKPETYDLSQIGSDWNKTMSLAKIKSDLVGAHFFPSSSGLKKVWVQPEDRNESGRVTQVSLLAGSGVTYKVSANDFRYLTHSRSNLFTLSQSSGELTIRGKGFGHGVGMAQLGALQYSKEMNWSAEEILHFYYQGVTLER